MAGPSWRGEKKTCHGSRARPESYILPMISPSRLCWDHFDLARKVDGVTTDYSCICKICGSAQAASETLSLSFFRAKNNAGEKSSHGCQPGWRKKITPWLGPAGLAEKQSCHGSGWLAEVANCHGVIFFRRKILLQGISPWTGCPASAGRRILDNEYAKTL